MRKILASKSFAITWAILFALSAIILLVYPVSGNTISSMLNQFAMVIILLTIPYGILKIIFHNAATKSDSEREIKLKDIAKDADEIKNK